jgi:putative tricarboxylic transport membrane protein
MLEAVTSALQQLATLEYLMFLSAGVAMGLAVGIFPGLGGIAGMSILLPFLYGMDPVAALALLIGLVAVIPTSDTFTSVLMGIPGSSASQATVMDGFPLAKKGQAARALAAAFSASLYGGLIGALVLTLFILVARPVILLFGTAELFMLAILGLSMVGVLAGQSLAKGVAACGLGLLLGAIGAAPATGEYRMNFGINYLVDGIPLVVVGLAIFAVPEIIDLLRRERAIAQQDTGLGAGWLQGVKDMWANKGLATRCAGIGCLVGALPGLGGSVVDWIAYGHVVQTSKDRENFGKGDIRGVLAPESANNAKEGGGLIPTILFGIPGSGSMAVFLGGLLLIGVDTGVNMVEADLDKTYVIIWSLALANVIGAGACLLLSKPVAKLTTLPYVYLAPFMIMVITFAAFQATRSWGDILALVAVGAFAVYMKRFGWPRPPLLIGFVLADPVESNLYQAVQFYDGWNWFWRPGVLIIFAVTVVSVYFGTRFAAKTAHGEGGEEGKATSLRPQIVFAAVILLIFLFGLYDSLQRDFLGQVFPLTIALVMLGFVLYALWIMIKGRTDHPIAYDAEVDYELRGRPEAVSAEHYLLWLVGLLVLTYLIGFVLAMAAFFVLFLFIKGRAKPYVIAILTAAAVGFLALMSNLLVLSFPAGLLQRAIDMPWPLN